MIRLLSKETIDKIAAGEVVERPENVTKELLDNAIDSGAKAVSVEIRGGGTDLIRVTDNGCGIEKTDLPNAFTRHATSKLVTAEDLNHIRTMGFRGEALASISGVSRVELITRRKEDLTGTRYVIEGGNELSVRDIGVPAGTTVIVRDLFFNVPVRRQFLKAAKTEASYVRDIVEKAALSRPDISFSFINDGKQVFHTSGNGKLLDVIYTIYGSETVSHVIPAATGTGEGSVKGYLSKPSLSRTRRDSEIYFVNGRFVKSNVIDRAIETAYEGYLMQHRFPFTVLMIDVEPEKIDVNIHPKKTEIRFSDDEAVFDLVFQTVKKTLSHREHIEDALKKEQTGKAAPGKHLEPFEQERNTNHSGPAENLSQMRDHLDDVYAKKETAEGMGAAVPNINKETAGERSPVYTSRIEGPENRKAENRKAENWKAENWKAENRKAENSRDEDKQAGNKQVDEGGCEQLKFIDAEAEKRYKFIGQVFDTYWMIEYDGAMYIIDQHAAHEKVNYERLIKQITSGGVYSQNIIPVILSLPAKDASALEDHLGDFAAFGYEIESAGDRDFIVRAVPASLPELSRKDLLTEMIDGLSEIRQGMKGTLLKEKIASMSCKAAVKGNSRLSEAEMKALIGELLKCEDPYNCPHGRPVMVKFSKYELDKMFKRIV